MPYRKLDEVAGIEISSRQVFAHVLPVLHTGVSPPFDSLRGRKLARALPFVEKGGELGEGSERGREGGREGEVSSTSCPSFIQESPRHLIL